METVQRIVVGVDGSEEAMKAVRWAADRAKVSGWELEILCAYALPSYTAASMESGMAVVSDEGIRASAEKVVDDAAEEVKDRGITIIKTVEPGDPTAVLIKRSKEVEMIAVGTRGGGGFADRLLGAVSSAIPAYSYCPVAVIPTQNDRVFIPAKKVVVGVDGSRPSQTSFYRALDEAKLWGAELLAVEAVPMATSAGVLAWLPAAIDRDAILEEVKENLEKAVAKPAEESGVTIRAHALDGNPASLLSEFSHAVDLVVVGTRGRGGFAGLLLGSTSQSVLEQSSAPVLVVPSTWKKDRH